MLRQKGEGVRLTLAYHRVLQTRGRLIVHPGMDRDAVALQALACSSNAQGDRIHLYAAAHFSEFIGRLRCGAILATTESLCCERCSRLERHSFAFIPSVDTPRGSELAHENARGLTPICAPRHELTGEMHEAVTRVRAEFGERNCGAGLRTAVSQ